MAKKKAGLKKTTHFKWRSLAVCVLTTLGILAFIGFTMVHWVERQLLTTKNWVDMVAPLSQNEVVADALSTHAIDKVVSATELQERVAEALPDRAAFLAPAITEQVDARLTKRTKEFIQSDSFNTIWQNANRVASTAILERARSEPNQDKQRKVSFNLDIPSLKSKIHTFLEEKTDFQPADPIDTNGEKVGVAVGLKTSFQRVRTYILAADYLNGVLWILSLVLFVGAIILAKNRNRLIFIIGCSFVLIGLLQLIGVKALRPMILNEVQNQSFRPAVEVVYNTLVASFNNGAMLVMWVGLGIATLAYLSRHSFINKFKSLKKLQKALVKSKVWQAVISARQFVYKYQLQFMLGAVLIGLVSAAFFVELDWQSLTQIILFVILTIEVINLAAVSPRRKPIEQTK